MHRHASSPAIPRHTPFQFQFAAMEKRMKITIQAAVLLLLTSAAGRAQDTTSVIDAVRIAPTLSELTRQVDQVRRLVRASDLFLKADILQDASGGASLMSVDGFPMSAATVTSNSKREMVGQ